MRDGRKGRDPRVPRSGVELGRSGRAPKRPALAETAITVETALPGPPVAELVPHVPVLAEAISPAPSPAPVLLPGGHPAPNAPLPFSDIPPAETPDADAPLEKGSSAEASNAADAWFALHDKMMNLVRLQRDTSLSMLGVLLTEQPLSDKIEAQARTAGRAIEAAAAQWLEISSTAQRLLGGVGPTVKPKQITDERNDA